MSLKDDEFLAKLQAAFKIEAEEHILAISNGLIELEKTPAPDNIAEIIETMYRDAHSLKGAARAVSMDSIESVCQVVESVFSALKRNRINLSTELFDTLHRTVDIMQDLLAGDSGTDVQEITNQLTRIEQKAKSREVVQNQTGPGPADSNMAPSKPKNAGMPLGGEESQIEEVTATEVVRPDHKSNRTIDTVRIAVEKLDPLLRQVGEMVSVKLTTRERIAELEKVIAIFDQWKKKWSGISTHGIRIRSLAKGTAKADDLGQSDSHLTGLMDFLDWNQNCIESLETKLRAIARATEVDARLHGGMVEELLQDMMNVLMLPCSSLLEVFPKLVRDVAREAGKEIRLELRGGDLEIDRRILEEIKEPLIHLIRNSIDHGIESPEVREGQHKARSGKISISISQVSGNQVELLVVDDGAGIDVEKVRSAAVRKGVISERESRELQSEEALLLVFRSEVSTSPIISNISGRGLGLAIVREKVESLGGHVTVSTTPGVGSSFRIVLPVTLSTFRGIFVNAHDQLFIVPTANVERVARIEKSLVKTVANRETIEMNGRPIPIVRLGDVLEIPRPVKKFEDSELVPVLILRSVQTLVAFSVDAILQEQEVLVKGLGNQLSRIRNVSGATVLGSGKLAPILHVPDLIKSAIKNAHAQFSSSVRTEESANGHKSVLIVEDSITSRMLLKNILESSGYHVKTAVDGLDAWNALNAEGFDLVVSDVEMPRMDGFELTTIIRKDQKLFDMPVVLVTSLGSKEDRERGIDAGANAYIVKGNFDQNNLLETVQRLV